jgi:hypothetical protein
MQSVDIEQIKDITKTVIDTYNDSKNRGLKYKTPNEVYDNRVSLIKARRPSQRMSTQ